MQQFTRSSSHYFLWITSKGTFTHFSVLNPSGLAKSGPSRVRPLFLFFLLALSGLFVLVFSLFPFLLAFEGFWLFGGFSGFCLFSGVFWWRFQQPLSGSANRESVLNTIYSDRYPFYKHCGCTIELFIRKQRPCNYINCYTHYSDSRHSQLAGSVRLHIPTYLHH